MSRAARSWSLSFALAAAALGLVAIRPAPRAESHAFVSRGAQHPRDPKGRLRLVHIADLPPLGAENLMEQFLSEMARLRPDAILVGGDVVYGETPAAYDAMADYLRRLEDLGIQVIVAPGNHERKAWPEYLRHFGTQTGGRTDLGSVSVIRLDSGHGRDQLTPSQFRSFQAALEGLEGRTPIVLLHHPLFKAPSNLGGEAGGSGGILHGFREPFIELCRSKGVALVLSGHWHCDAVFDAQGHSRTDGPDLPGPLFVVTTSLGNELREVVPGVKLFHGYRVLEFEGGRLRRYTEDLDGDGRPDPVVSRPLGRAFP